MARDNGLPAQAWTHVADLDPWVADAALDALRRAGVAAYTTPHPGHRGAYLDVQLPDRPTDRLYVEAGAAERAAVVLADLGSGEESHPADRLPGGNASDVDAAFAEIVAHLELDETAGEPSGTSSPTVEPPAAADGRVIRGAVGWDDLFFAEHLRPPQQSVEGEEGFVPPPPPPVPRGTPLRRFAWAAVVGCPLVVLVCVLTEHRLDGWVGLLVVGGFVAGLVTLFATLGEREDDGDDGAVV